MASRRNRIVVKPNLKPSVPKAASVQKPKPIPTLVSPDPTTPIRKSVSQLAQLPAIAEENGKPELAAASYKGNEASNGTADDNVKQKLSSFLKKPGISDGTLDPDKIPNNSDGVLHANKDRESTTQNVSVEKDTISLREKSPIRRDTTPREKDTTATTTPQPVINDSNQKSASDTIAPVSVVEKTTSSVEAATVVDDSTVVNAEVSDFETEVTVEMTEKTEGETKQPKRKRRKREKKERKEKLPPSDKSPDRHKMKMSDLIVWNPSQNFIPKKKKAPASKKEERPVTPESEISADDESSNQSASLPAPQVMIGPDGNIVLNTQSLIIETAKSESKAKAIVEEDDDDRYLNSNTYRKTPKAKMWTEKENETFFLGLSMCGTDFSLMCNLLPKRTRRELKNKFRREERQNRVLIDKALACRRPYDIAPFEKIAEEEAIRLKNKENMKKESRQKQKQEEKARKEKSIKKEKGRTRKRKRQEWEEEEDEMEEPEYDDEADENIPEDKSDESLGSTTSNRRKKQSTIETASPNVPNMEVIDIQIEQRPAATTTTTTTTAAASSHRGLAANQTLRQIMPDRNSTNRLNQGLRSIPGSAPIQIEMEGMTNPMQGVLIPSHLVPQLAPQLGIPTSSTPMQVLLVQEEGSRGNLVHVYVIPDKDNASSQAASQGIVTSNETGLTLTSPVPSPRPASRRPSFSSNSAPASPFSPPHPPPPSGNFPAVCKTPPSSRSESETSLSTIRSVYGNAMSSLSERDPTNPVPVLSTESSHSQTTSNSVSVSNVITDSNPPPTNSIPLTPCSNAQQPNLLPSADLSINGHNPPILSMATQSSANNQDNSHPTGMTLSPSISSHYSMNGQQSQTTNVLIQSSHPLTATEGVNLPSNSPLAASGNLTHVSVSPTTGALADLDAVETEQRNIEAMDENEEDCVIINGNQPQSQVEQIK